MSVSMGPGRSRGAKRATPMYQSKYARPHALPKRCIKTTKPARPSASSPQGHRQNRLWPSEDDVEVSSTACVNVGGYSVHAATAIKPYERERLEKLVRYMSRPAISDERLSVMPDGTIRLKLKTPWKDGTEFLEFTPSEFRGGGPIEKLIALIPIPKFHLTRYYGVFASRSALRNKLPDIPEPASELWPGF